MSVQTLNRNVTLRVMECGTCGIAFAIPETLYDHCFKEGGYWYCPAGHCRGWDEGQKERDRKDLQQQLARSARSLELAETRNRELRQWAEQAERRLSATKGVVTRIKNRVKNGVCPCCNRTFQNLMVHMKKQHPDFMEQPTE
jgi:hypothetical protein